MSTNLLNNKNPFLSIVIPTYKRSKKLEFLLSLLEKQKSLTTLDYEIIVSDNCSGDSTKDVIDRYKIRMPTLKYYCHEKNIGAEKNIFSLYSRASGSYIWLMPDDDQVANEFTLSTVIEKIKKCALSPAFVILNAKAIDVETHELIKDRFNPIIGDIFLTDGRDILNLITDLDLIGAQRLIIRKDVFPDPFIDSYMSNPNYLVPMVCALAASSKGPALIVGETLSVFGDNDPTPWRVYWPYIALQLMPEMLLKASKDLGYSDELVKKIILRRKNENFNNIIPYWNRHFLVFQKYNLSWARLANLYGCTFIFFKIITGIPISLIRLIIPIKITKFVFSKLKMIYNK
jgi:glycosyltransferase involved in cell wall biosynthesis